MRKRILDIIILLTILAAIAVNIKGKESVDTIALQDFELDSVMPEGDAFRKIEEPVIYYEIYKRKELIGYCFNTRDTAPDKKGYSGHIEMLVGISKLGRIEDLKILNHKETPMYTEEIEQEGFLGQFKGKNYEDAFIVGKDVDGVTHATISSRAVAETLKASLDKMEGVFLGTGEEKITKVSLQLDANFYITVLLMAFLLTVHYLRISWLRYVGLALSIFYFGFMKSIFISMSSLGSIFSWNVPNFASNPAWFAFIFLGIILTLFLGGFYCTYVCPFGGIQIFLSKIFKFNIKISQVVTKNLRKIRSFLLWILIIIVLLLNNPNIVDYEPFSTVFLMQGSAVAWVIVGIILISSLFYHRPFCTYFCSAGAFLDILAKFGRKVFRRKS